MKTKHKPGRGTRTLHFLVRYFFWHEFSKKTPKAGDKILFLCDDGEVFAGEMCCEDWCNKPHYNTTCMCPTTPNTAVMWRRLPIIPNRVISGKLST